MNATATQQSPSPSARQQVGPTLFVDHPTEEGVIQIDGATGVRLTPVSECPVWAQGLANAMLAERVAFWEGRLGKDRASEHLQKETISYSDLSWVGMDNEGKEVEIEANFEYRSPLIGELLGMHMETGRLKNAEHEYTLAEADQKAPDASQEGVSTAELAGSHQDQAGASGEKKQASGN